MSSIIRGTDGKPIFSQRPTHPGSVLKREIEFRNLLKKDVAAGLKISPSYLSDLLSGKKNISVSLSIELESLLGISAEFWLNLQSNFELSMLRLHRLETVH